MTWYLRFGLLKINLSPVWTVRSCSHRGQSMPLCLILSEVVQGIKGLTNTSKTTKTRLFLLHCDFFFFQESDWSMLFISQPLIMQTAFECYCVFDSDEDTIMSKHWSICTFKDYELISALRSVLFSGSLLSLSWDEPDSAGRYAGNPSDCFFFNFRYFEHIFLKQDLVLVKQSFLFIIFISSLVKDLITSYTTGIQWYERPSTEVLCWQRGCSVVWGPLGVSVTLLIDPSSSAQREHRMSSLFHSQELVLV